jgi:hypothetical protein
MRSLVVTIGSQLAIAYDARLLEQTTANVQSRGIQLNITVTGRKMAFLTRQAGPLVLMRLSRLIVHRL